MRSAPSLWIVWAELIGPKGSRTIRALIDTGADTCLIPPKTLMEIGCDPALSKERAEILTASRSEVLRVVRVPEIIALGSGVRDIDVMSHDLLHSKVEGILGLDFLLQVPDFQQLAKRFQKFFL